MTSKYMGKGFNFTIVRNTDSSTMTIFTYKIGKIFKNTNHSVFFY